MLSWQRLSSLRTRLSLGFLLATFIACAAFAVATHEVVDVIQDKIMRETLARELDMLAAQQRAGMTLVTQNRPSRRVYVSAHPDDDPALPPVLNKINQGHYRTVRLDGHTFSASRIDTARGGIFLMINIDTVAALKHHLIQLGWMTLAATIVLALLIAFVFSSVILRPVHRLADKLTATQPGRAHTPIAAGYADKDLARIARSFDALVARFDAAIAREKAFTEDASHELRTPLAVTAGAVELLAGMDNLDARAQQRVARAQEGCARMARLISALLFLAREQGGGASDHSDAAWVARDVLSYQQAALAERRIETIVETEATPLDVPDGVIDSVLHNLIENAIRHTRDGQLFVQVSPERIRIRDTGSGMSAETQAHVFARRYRSGNSPGLGLGLYLVYRICERQGWSIALSSRERVGTTFDIRLGGSA